MASLLDNHLGFKFTRVRTIVRIPWISPLRGLNPQPTRGPSQTPLLLVFIGSVVSIQTCTVWAPGPNPHSVSKSVGIVLTLKPTVSDEALLPTSHVHPDLSLSYNSRVTVYWFTSTDFWATDFCNSRNLKICADATWKRGRLRKTVESKQLLGKYRVCWPTFSTFHILPLHFKGFSAHGIKP